jgi:hypothetical protein
MLLAVHTEAKLPMHEEEVEYCQAPAELVTIALTADLLQVINQDGI